MACKAGGDSDGRATKKKRKKWLSENPFQGFGDLDGRQTLAEFDLLVRGHKEDYLEVICFHSKRSGFGDLSSLLEGDERGGLRDLVKWVSTMDLD